VAILGGNIVAGYLWSEYGPRMTFAAGALLATVTLAGYLLFLKWAPGLGRFAAQEGKQP